MFSFSWAGPEFLFESLEGQRQHHDFLTASVQTLQGLSVLLSRLSGQNMFTQPL